MAFDCCLFIYLFIFDVVYRPLSQRKKSITKDYSYLLFTLQLLALIPQTVAVFAIGYLLTYPVKDLYTIKLTKLEDPNECIITI